MSMSMLHGCASVGGSVHEPASGTQPVLQMQQYTPSSYLMFSQCRHALVPLQSACCTHAHSQPQEAVLTCDQ